MKVNPNNYLLKAVLDMKVTISCLLNYFDEEFNIR
jgi:hypothetical protein